MAINIRVATNADLPPAKYIWLAAEGEMPREQPQPGDPVPSALTHELRSGKVLVAEDQGESIGFAAMVPRDNTDFLSQLFILPRKQSSGVGRLLLEAIMPAEGRERATLATTDPRAVGLYVRHGMQPRWPALDLVAQVDALRPLPRAGVSVVGADVGDPDLVSMDAAIGGRERAQDHVYWVQMKAGVPLWFERRGERIGYGYVLVQPRSSDARWYSEAVRIGPLGVLNEADAVDCLACAIQWARDQGNRLSVLIPGPHPALRPLLEAGFRIGDIETFLSSRETPFTAGRRYVPSGGGLF